MLKLYAIAISATLHTLPGTALAQVEAPEAEPALSPQVERLVGWLPTDTETLLVAQQPWVFQMVGDMMGDRDPDDFSPEESAHLLRITLNSMPVMLMLGAEVPSAKDELVGKKIVLAVSGNRKFTPAKGMGIGSYEGCELLVVDKEAQPAVDTIMKRCAEHATRTIEHAGVTAYAIEQEDGVGGTLTLIFCRLEPTMLACARDEGYLKELLDRRAQAQHEGRALPVSLPEWKHVNTKAGLWGIRHYQPNEAKDDRSTPLHAQPAIPLRDAEAVGFAFSFDPHRDPNVEVTHVTGAEDAVEKCREAWSVINPDAKVSAVRLAPDVVQVGLSPDDPYAAMNCWTMLAVFAGYMMGM